MSVKELDGRRIIVTGAASGMGKAIATKFAAEGARQLLIDVDADGLTKLSLPGTTSIAIDLADPEQVDRAVDRAVADMGGIDGIVNSAGILRVVPFEKTDRALFSQVLGVNLFGPYYLCHAALPHLQKAGKATIVNISSVAGKVGPKGMSAYASSKAGLLGLTRVLAAELAPAIRSNAILPGVIDTPMVSGMVRGNENVAASIAANLPLARPGTAEEVAELALFLTSDRSSFITGATHAIDGGSTFH